MNWVLSHRADQITRQIADRHYNRQKIGTPQFVPPGRCLVLRTESGDAFWVTSFPFAQYVKHQWAGAWMCSAFRNEGSLIASDLIRDAVACTAWKYGEPPRQGLITFIDPRKVKPTIRHGKKVWGYTYWKAGFKWVTDKSGRLIRTKKDGLIVMRLPPWRVPQAEAPNV